MKNQFAKEDQQLGYNIPVMCYPKIMMQLKAFQVAVVFNIVCEVACKILKKDVANGT